MCGLVPVAQNIGTFLRWVEASEVREGKTVVKDFSRRTSSSLLLLSSSSSSSCMDGVLLRELPNDPDFLSLVILLAAGLGVMSPASDSLSDSYSISGITTLGLETTV